jgi:hypothetical protein
MPESTVEKLVDLFRAALQECIQKIGADFCEIRAHGISVTIKTEK